VDTERNFPFSDKIDYSSFALIIDFRDIKKLPERIAEFHNIFHRSGLKRCRKMREMPMSIISVLTRLRD